MTTSFQLDATLEFAARTGTVRESVPDRVTAPPLAEPIMRLAPPVAADDGLILDWDAADRSTLNCASIGAQCRRALRMRAPFVLADVLALMLSAMIAQGAMWLVYPAAAACLGPAAALALLPLIGAYGLSALYSGIWVHPVIEFRQPKHVSNVGFLAAAFGGMLSWA